MDHCSEEFHPGRRCGMTIEENFQSKKFISAQHCNKPHAHQRNRNFWSGKVNNGDLSKEIENNGFQHVLTSGLHEQVKKKLINERHIQMGSPLSSEQMLAMILGYESRSKTNPFFKYGTFISASRYKEVAFSFMSPDPHAQHNIGSILEINLSRDEDENEIIGADVSWISKFSIEGEFLIARLVQLGINDLQYHPEGMFYMVKASVEFFAHRGHMCFSLEHDISECKCDFHAGRRPSWMPPPENVLL